MGFINRVGERYYTPREGQLSTNPLPPLTFPRPLAIEGHAIAD